ncbi:MAG: sigma-70 family RNA polymerase sigma factor [candidate division KSB1 bacterium]|nr:sigma-70 family RNA polymerase sigma factor [candidate division KSB1 bacterium]
MRNKLVTDVKSMDDEALVDKFQRGDTEAFGELVRRYEDKVMATCVRMLGNREDAEDAAQEVFVKAFDALPRFDPRAKFSTWLYRVATNHCLNVLRARRVRRVLPLERSALEPDGYFGSAQRDPAPGPDGDLEREERGRALWKAIDSLPESQKVATVLARFGNLSYAEIAEVMETSVSAVESILHRAKRRLYRQLSHMLEEKA